MSSFKVCEDYQNSPRDFAILSASQTKLYGSDIFESQIMNAFDDDYVKMAKHFLGIEPLNPNACTNDVKLANFKGFIDHHTDLRNDERRKTAHEAMRKDLILLYLRGCPEIEEEELFETKKIKSNGLSTIEFKSLRSPIIKEINSSQKIRGDYAENRASQIEEIKSNLISWLKKDEMKKLKSDFYSLKELNETKILTSNLVNLICRVRDSVESGLESENNYHDLRKIQLKFFVDALIKQTFGPSKSMGVPDGIIKYKEALEYLVEKVNVSWYERGNKPFKYHTKFKDNLKLTYREFLNELYNDFMDSLIKNIKKEKDEQVFKDQFDKLFHLASEQMVSAGLLHYMTEYINNPDSSLKNDKSKIHDYAVLFISILKTPENWPDQSGPYIDILKSQLGKTTIELSEKILTGKEPLYEHLKKVGEKVFNYPNPEIFIGNYFGLLLHIHADKQQVDATADDLDQYLKLMTELCPANGSEECEDFKATAKIVFSPMGKKKKEKELSEVVKKLMESEYSSHTWFLLLKPYSLDSIGLKKSKFWERVQKTKPGLIVL